MSKDRVIKDVIRAAGPKNVIVITAQDFKEILASIAEFAMPRYVVDMSKLDLPKDVKPGTIIPVDKHGVPLLKNLNKDNIVEEKIKKGLEKLDKQIIEDKMKKEEVKDEAKPK